MMDGSRIRMRDNGGLWREPCTALVVCFDRYGCLRERGFSHPTPKAEVLKVVDQWMARFEPGTDWEVIVIPDGAD